MESNAGQPNQLPLHVDEKDELFYQQTWGVRDIPILSRDKYPFWHARCQWHIHSGEFWYQFQGDQFYVHIFDEPGTLAHEILAGKSDLPEYGKNLFIRGNHIEVVHEPPQHPKTEPEEEDDSEDCSDELATLPVVEFDESLHFTKPPSYKSEIQNLLQFRGSSRIIQLLGRTTNNHLAFPRYKSDLFMAAIRLPIAGRRATIKKWMLELIEAVIELHAAGLVHRDLVLRNVLLADPLVLCDLQCRYSSYICRAPEVRDWDTAQYSPASDIYALGYCLREMCYANTPYTRFPDYPVPYPFDKIFEACIRDNAKDRPTMIELREMVENVNID
ncbi:kinase domain protein [Ceratobasidium sp. AG-Ba]|nr:kinase domain protein [Ceratobasidium sp. AG-Ba]